MDVQISAADSVYRLGRVHAERGNLDKAEFHLRRAVALFAAAVPENDPRLAVCLGELASVLQEKGDFVEAERLWRRALAVERAHGRTPARLSTGLVNLAYVCETLGNLTEAESLNREAVAAAEAVSGDDPELFAHALGHLAGFFSRQGRDEEARAVSPNADAVRGKRARAAGLPARLRHPPAKRPCFLH